ncbi:MAG TPA: LuxR C-terminal-related transcriptional regulator [Acidimicrobiales bacterium]|nr:LuxR C-terminal-related transcriptional regulator [Acidimicrobiales bacterium]
MRGKIPVFVYAADPLSAAGAKAQLMGEPGIELLGPVDIDRARVALLVTEAADAATARVVRAIQRDGVPGVVLVAGRFDVEGVVAAAAAGVSGFLRRTDATSSRLVAAIREADQPGCHLPEGLMRKAAAMRGHLGEASEVVDVTDDGPVSASPADGSVSTIAAPRLSVREAEVLRLVAEGYDTADVAEKLAYSESTIKGILAKVMTKIEARNRCHAVAIVMRNGLI